ncbi:MAG TPA: UDP-N-acetylglucosamine pyrophosphorylase [Haliscomenobacter sp.]|uniref:DapH/DapD/GlmU-related protein n=1 Tax=Haliscomenobacter sp. TaxID=2717303 RepID=UPI002B99D1E0|nr:DapH/DapD/GlmU-related protein [Haliscomenobacter sp.]HOY17542.1 UDP-N-acetylglucosamine pyrophosphorylase [Haliscomenobacter sp.]HPH17834.1 UDP-N-acetylglucosamine pyrophosphorylase [Haliscomenobacter sp.]
MMHPLSIRLFDFTHTLAAPLLERVHYPWEVLPKIAEYIQELAQQLPADFEEIAPQVWVGQGTYIEKTALIMGPAIIGRNCQIRHSAFIRDQVIMGDRVVVGNSSEVKNAILFDEVQIPHFNYVGDSILGYRAHLGAGAILSNFKSTHDEINVYLDEKKMGTGLRKFGALIGDRVEIGSNAVLFPGTIVGRDAVIYPLCPVRGYVAEGSILKNDGSIFPRK